jgi:hypothetical protein
VPSDDAVEVVRLGSAAKAARYPMELERRPVSLSAMGRPEFDESEWREYAAAVRGKEPDEVGPPTPEDIVSYANGFRQGFPSARCPAAGCRRRPMEMLAYAPAVVAPRLSLWNPDGFDVDVDIYWMFCRSCGMLATFNHAG